MKNPTLFLICITLILGVISPVSVLAADEAHEISLIIDGQVVFCSPDPIVQNGIVLIPVRTIAESFGATLAWSAANKTVKIIHNDTDILIQMDLKIAYVNGRAKSLGMRPIVINGRTMVPAKFIAEAFNASAGWNPASKEVVILSNNFPEPINASSSAGDYSLSLPDGWVVSESLENSRGMISNEANGEFIVSSFAKNQGTNPLKFLSDYADEVYTKMDKAGFERVRSENLSDAYPPRYLETYVSKKGVTKCPITVYICTTGTDSHLYDFSLYTISENVSAREAVYYKFFRTIKINGAL